MSRLKSVAPAIYVFASIALFFVVAVTLLRGTAWVSVRVLPFLIKLVGVTAFFGLPVLVLIAFIRPIRVIAAAGFVLASSIFWHFALGVGVCLHARNMGIGRSNSWLAHDGRDRIVGSLDLRLATNRCRAGRSRG